MKTLFSLVAGLYAILVTQFIAADTLRVVIENVASSEGNIMLEILSTEAEFNGESPAVAAIIQRAQTGKMTFTTDALPPGEYAIRVMHDKNGNGELDSNFVGIPKEPWAFSNNATGKFGPPKWQAAKFALDGESTQAIALNQ